MIPFPHEYIPAAKHVISQPYIQLRSRFTESLGGWGKTNQKPTGKNRDFLGGSGKKSYHLLFPSKKEKHNFVINWIKFFWIKCLNEDTYRFTQCSLISIQVKMKVLRVIALYLQNWPEALENDAVENLKRGKGGKEGEMKLLLIPISNSIPFSLV